VPVASGYVYVCWDISILPVSTLYLFDIGTVPTVWYFIYKNCTQNLVKFLASVNKCKIFVIGSKHTNETKIIFNPM